jgi:hypothetical protein
MYVNKIIHYTSIPVTFVVQRCVSERVTFWRAVELKEVYSMTWTPSD